MVAGKAADTREGKGDKRGQLGRPWRRSQILPGLYPTRSFSPEQKVGLYLEMHLLFSILPYSFPIILQNILSYGKIYKLLKNIF